MTRRSGFLGLERIPELRLSHRVSRVGTALAINQQRVINLATVRMSRDTSIKTEHLNSSQEFPEPNSPIHFNAKRQRQQARSTRHR